MLFGLRAFALAVPSWEDLPSRICTALLYTGWAHGNGAPCRRPSGSITSCRDTPFPTASLSCLITPKRDRYIRDPCSCVGLTVPCSRTWEGEDPWGMSCVPLAAIIAFTWSRAQTGRCSMKSEQGPSDRVTSLSPPSASHTPPCFCDTIYRDPDGPA